MTKPKKAPKRPAKSVSKARGKKVASRARSKKPPVAEAELPARPPTKPRDWALAAYVAIRGLLDRPADATPLIGAWEDAEAGAARTLYLRAQGRDVKPSDEMIRCFPPPRGFVSWKKALAELEEVAVWPPMEALRDGKRWKLGPCAVSPYAVTIADDEAHPLFDSRGRWKPAKEFVASLRYWGGNFDALKLKGLAEGGKRDVLYVEDGRQRVNGVRAANLEIVIDWYRAQMAGAAVEMNTSSDAHLRLGLIDTMSAEIKGHSLREAQAMAAASNTQRRQDQWLQLVERAGKMRAPTVGEGSKEEPGMHQHQIADVLGVSRQTVANLLLVQDLHESLWPPMRQGKLTQTVAYLLAVLDHDKQRDLWAKVEMLPADRRADALRALIAGREIPTPGAAKPRTVKDVETMRLRLEGLEGSGPMVARAVLDYVLGRKGPEVFRDMPDDLQQQFRMPTVGAASEPEKTGKPKRGNTTIKPRHSFESEEAQEAWEAAGVFDARTALELGKAGITPDDAARPFIRPGEVTCSFGQAYTQSRIDIPEIKNLLRQVPLPSSEAV